MHLDEFKAWFEGFCDGIYNSPDSEQFDKLKAKIELLTTRPSISVGEMLAEEMKRGVIDGPSDDGIPF